VSRALIAVGFVAIDVRDIGLLGKPDAEIASVAASRGLGPAAAS
jgi:hypothetical protein